MNTITGVLEELYIENGTTKGIVKTDNGNRSVPLFFILNARAGDTVVIDAGIATTVHPQEEENEYVLSHTRQSNLN